MAVDVVTHIVIERPVRQVADFASNPDNAPLWYVNIKSVTWKTPPPVRVGSEIAFVAHFLWRRLAYTYEVVEWARDRRFVMRTAEGPFPMETTYSWDPAPGGATLMTLRNAGSPAGVAKLFAPFMARAMRSANQKDLIALKKLLEARPSESTN